MDLRQHWKEWVNLLVLTPADENYSVLTVRGNPNCSVKSRSYVTPGGTLDASDFSSKWWQLFETFGSNSDSLHKCLSGFVWSRPPIIANNVMLEELRRSSCDEDDFVSTDMALRIAAIRHLFVQTGILLVKSTNKLGLISDISEKWRQRVSECPRNFFEMCDQLNLMPDLFSLKEWWNWLTPSSVGTAPRFDSIYYICCVNDINMNESQHWSTPQSLIERKQRDGYFLAPPQIYEFSRIMNFKDVQDVHEFATQRQKHGIDRWIPVLSLYDDGALSLLPGDELYPDCVELIATKPLKAYSQSLEDIRRKSIRMNRMELRGTDCQVVVNTDMPLKHIRPVSQYFNSESTGIKL